MRPESLALALRVAVGEFRAAVTTAPPDAPVPTCPGWTVDQLTAHVGQVFTLVADWIRTGRRRAPTPVPAASLDHFTVSAETLLDLLDPRQAARPCATWCPWDHTLGFWIRRMAHEAVIHRADAESALGAISPVPAELAADGVHELLTLWLGTRQPPRVTGEHVVRLEVPGRTWTIGLNPWVIDYHEGAEPDVVLRGPASALDLWLWGRGDAAELTVEGDRSAVAALRAAVAAVT
ncbi:MULTISPECIES: maleylpyruvate isomerase family mycothiol-dependent enzyme [unclassified Crossiella]|uniref:maleylpyruvate isomerase family mycothiol-dependent enzyme n=1 Tax=unclassified Crossiella TaxID=2620835 RepID=UPI001FFE4DD8|nr:MULTISPECIES: maleylpyruvate isomerase family mycothiol-dependent enzyme [unclassified Crossiella]MCK2241186.1 maleylpyruvate isomerase family mycothiol-dependent enzyme [Crossiella sp. S99.2]MCK2253670.1 maleylpyruvate isomerase family mycothiol-dependent enzyme [Crossiella sp. S99.1]